VSTRVWQSLPPGLGRATSPAYRLRWRRSGRATEFCDADARSWSFDAALGTRRRARVVTAGRSDRLPGRFAHSLSTAARRVTDVFLDDSAVVVRDLRLTDRDLVAYVAAVIGPGEVVARCAAFGRASAERHRVLLDA
jgi:hypothetical protein